jgi:predicted nucleic acid-binding protein
LIVVDTSVWVAGFRGDLAVVAELRRLLDDDLAALAGPVRMELLAGARVGELGQLRRVLGAVPTYAPADAEWARVERWIDVAVARGQRFGVVDLLIGATAAEHAASVWSLDDDFERMAKLRLVKLHRPKRARR